MAGEPTHDDFQDHFIDVVVVADIGEGTDVWKLDGSAYPVDLR
ncbi:hypothetical protein ACFT7S_34845 [Streptomyces sp. NPDC057136]